MSVQALSTGYTGLQAAQVGIDTASNNIANANTQGYTRQRVNLAANLPVSLTFGQIGTGVHVEDIARTRDAFLDERVRAANSSLQALDARAGLLDRAEAMLAEPDHGLAAHLDSLWDSFEELALDPTNRGNRVEVGHRLDALTARVNQIAAEIDALAADTRDRVSSTITEANALIARVAELNDAIARARGQGTPNLLLDRRDLALDRLTELTGATVSYTDDGMARVSLSGLSLVLGTSTNDLVWNPAADTISHEGSGIALTMSGVLGGRQQFLVEDTTAVRGAIEQFASEVADALNTQHQAGFVSAGVPGGALLSYDPLDPAGTLAVALASPDDLAMSDADGVPFPEFNGENGMRLAELRTTLAALGGTASLSSLARALVADVGGRVAAARSGAESQQDLASAAQLARESEHGVSIDEEMIDLIRYQRAFGAAARVITAADEALDTLINRTGLVGR